MEAKDKTSIEQVNLVSPDSDNFMPNVSLFNELLKLFRVIF